MAKVKLNPTFEAIQGKVGELVYKRWEGEEIVSTGVFKMRNGMDVVVDNTLAPKATFSPEPPNT